MKQTKEHILYVDHIFHTKTKSNDFLKDFLAEHFLIESMYIDPSNTDTPSYQKITECVADYAYVVFFQVLPPLPILCKIQEKVQVIWVPMYDGEKFNRHFWNTLSCLNVHIVSFTESIHTQALQYNLQSVAVRYAIDPDRYQMQLPGIGHHIFFWYRGGVSFEEIKHILPSREVDTLIYKSTPDPNVSAESLSEEDIQIYHIKRIDSGFIEKDSYLQLLSQANMFIAPRKKEGIGMSFLEALAMGHYIIAYNDSTMNEYITDSRIGYLFDEHTTAPVSFEYVESSYQYRIEYAQSLFATWESQKSKILDLFYKTNRKFSFLDKMHFWYQYWLYRVSRYIIVCMYQIQHIKKHI